VGICCDIMGDPEPGAQTTVRNANGPTSSGKLGPYAVWWRAVHLPATTTHSTLHERHLRPHVRMLASSWIWKTQLQGDTSLSAEEESRIRPCHVICGFSVVYRANIRSSRGATRRSLDNCTRCYQTGCWNWPLQNFWIKKYIMNCLHKNLALKLILSVYLTNITVTLKDYWNNRGT